MKAKLLVNLKDAVGEYHPAGTVYDNVDGAFPDHVHHNINDSRIIQILDETPSEFDRNDQPGEIQVESVTAELFEEVKRELTKREEVLVTKENELAERAEAITVREAKLTEKEAALVKREEELEQVEEELSRREDALIEREAAGAAKEVTEGSEEAPGGEAAQGEAAPGVEEVKVPTVPAAPAKIVKRNTTK